MEFFTVVMTRSPDSPVSSDSSSACSSPRFSDSSRSPSPPYSPRSPSPSSPSPHSPSLCPSSPHSSLTPLQLSPSPNNLPDEHHYSPSSPLPIPPSLPTRSPSAEILGTDDEEDGIANDVNFGVGRSPRAAHAYSCGDVVKRSGRRSRSPLAHRPSSSSTPSLHVRLGSNEDNFPDDRYFRSVLEEMANEENPPGMITVTASFPPLLSNIFVGQVLNETANRLLANYLRDREVKNDDTRRENRVTLTVSLGVGQP